MGSGGHRRRLGSDSSSKSNSVKLRQSNTSLEKFEIPESPPSSPPPPYTEFDSADRRFSLSQQQHHNPNPSGYGVQMHRTRSQGYVTSPSLRNRLYVGTPNDEMGRRDRVMSPEGFRVRSPALVDGGTLV